MMRRVLGPVRFPWYNQWAPHFTNYVALRNICLYRDNEPVAITSAAPMQVWHYTNGAWRIRYDGPGTNVFPRLQQGHYLIQSGNEQTSFMVLSTNWDSAAYAPIGASFGSDWKKNYPGDGSVKLQMALNPRWSRNWGGDPNNLYRCVEWSCIQTSASPNTDTWNWGPLDRWVNLFTNSNDTAVLVYAAWNSDNEPWQSTNNPAAFCGQYAEFVRALIRRYRLLIASNRFQIEIWNEPNGDWHFPTGTSHWTQVYCDMVSSCAVVKAQERSSVRLIGPVTQGPVYTDDLWQRLSQTGVYTNLYAISFHNGDGSFRQTEFNSVCPVHDRTTNSWMYYMERMTNYFGQKPIYRGEVYVYGRSSMSLTSCQDPGGRWQSPYGEPFVAGGWPCYNVDPWTVAMRWVRHEIVTLSYGTTNDLAQLHAALYLIADPCPTNCTGWVWTAWGPEFKVSPMIGFQPWVDRAHNWWHTNDLMNGSVYAWTRGDGSTVAAVWTQEGRTKIPARALPQRYDCWGNAVGWIDIREEPTFFLSVKSPAAAGADALVRITQEQ